MKRKRSLVVLLAFLSLVGADAAAQPQPLQIGMAKSFVHEQPKGFIEIASDDFKNVMKKATGLDGELVAKFGAAEVADKVKSKQFDFGIFHAHELAWLQEKNPDLRPLLI